MYICIYRAIHTDHSHAQSTRVNTANTNNLILLISLAEQDKGPLLGNICVCLYIYVSVCLCKYNVDPSNRWAETLILSSTCP